MLDWFTTIPGILISAGVILLIISVVLFITGNKQDKKEAKVEKKEPEIKITEPVVEEVKEAPKEELLEEVSEVELPIEDKEETKEIEIPTEEEMEITFDEEK